MTIRSIKTEVRYTLSTSSSGIKCLSEPVVKNTCEALKTMGLHAIMEQEGEDYEINPYQRQHYSSLSNYSGNIWDQQLEHCWTG